MAHRYTDFVGCGLEWSEENGVADSWTISLSPGWGQAARAMTVHETLWVATSSLCMKFGQTARFPVLEHSATDISAVSCVCDTQVSFCMLATACYYYV